MLIDQFEQLVVHCSRLFWRAFRERLGSAMREVIAHERPAHGPERLLHGGNLNHNVGAVPVVLDHFLNTANLTFDAA